MRMETLPSSFLIIYGIFIITALITAIISNARDRLIPFAYMTIILSIGAPLFSFLYTVGRAANRNELEHLFHQIGEGRFTAIILLLCYVYLFFWLGLFVWHYFGKAIKKYSLLLWHKLKESPLWSKLSKQRGE